MRFYFLSLFILIIPMASFQLHLPALRGIVSISFCCFAMRFLCRPAQPVLHPHLFSQ